MSMPKPMPAQQPVAIDFSALESLPDRVRGTPERPWVREEMDALLMYWPVKRQADVAKALGRGIGVCRRKYEELTK